MNNKGEMLGFGIIISVFIAVIVGAILLTTSAQQVGSTTDTFEIANTSLTTVVNGTPQYITNARSLSSVVIYNETGNVIVGSGNYTVENNVVYNGALAVKITPDASAEFKSAWKVSGTAQPLTYIDDSGGRSVATLIIIFFALGIAMVALYPVYKEKLMDYMK